MCRSRSSGCPAPAADAQSFGWAGQSVLAAGIAGSSANGNPQRFYTVRSISLPVYRRLLRDQHLLTVSPYCSGLCCLLAGKTDSPTGAAAGTVTALAGSGVPGDKGEFALMTLDDELRERQIEWPGCGLCWPSPGFWRNSLPDRYLLAGARTALTIICGVGISARGS